ncbi:MAG: YetF domain-containing protein [Chitinophagales bacterium]
MKPLLLMAVRTVGMYLFLLVVMRFAGKREIGQVSPFDFVVAVLIGELAAIPLEGHRIPLIFGLVPIATIVLAQVATAYLCLWNNSIRAWTSGRPTVLMTGGRIDAAALRRHRFNISDLLSKLRQQNVYNIDDVEAAILEDTGHLSVILKSQRRPVTPQDLGLSTPYEGLPHTLILDGKIDYASLAVAGLDYTWLHRELVAHGFTSPSEVLLATLETSGKTHFYPRAAVLAPDSQP